MKRPIATLSEIIENKQILSGIYSMKIKAPEIARQAEPGQFLHIRCFSSLHPLLRRPISIAGVDENSGYIKLIYRTVGEGTKLLSEKVGGTRLDVIGPLGNGFPLQDKNPSIIIGGGIGAAPLLYLAQKIAALKKGAVGFLGFATKDEVFGIDYFNSLGIDTYVTTDDGTLGRKALPTALLEEFLKSRPAREYAIYACGPKPMLKRVKEIAKREGISAYLSLEERMACGVGACLGCSVKSSKKGYKKVCKDGPVFEADQIELD